MSASKYTIEDGFSDPDSYRFIQEHYGDLPLRGMPSVLLRRLFRIWHQRDDVFLLLAKDGGTCVGFLLAQAVGARPWRALLLDPIVLPYALLVLARKKLLKRGSEGGVLSGKAEALSSDPDGEIPSQLRTNWGRHQAANVEFIFVQQSERGRGLAHALLERLTEDLHSHQIPVGLAYIAPNNFSSVSAFRKAGWTVVSDAGVLRAFKMSAS